MCRTSTWWRLAPECVLREEVIEAVALVSASLRHVITLYCAGLTSMHKTLVRLQGRQRITRIGHLIVDRHAECDSPFTEVALAFLERRIAVRAQHEDEMRLPRIMLLYAQRGFNQVIEHLRLGAPDERRQ